MGAGLSTDKTGQIKKKADRVTTAGHGVIADLIQEYNLNRETEDLGEQEHTAYCAGMSMFDVNDPHNITPKCDSLPKSRRIGKRHESKDELNKVQEICRSKVLRVKLRVKLINHIINTMQLFDRKLEKVLAGEYCMVSSGPPENARLVSRATVAETMNNGKFLWNRDKIPNYATAGLYDVDDIKCGALSYIDADGKEVRVTGFKHKKRLSTLR